MISFGTERRSDLQYVWTVFTGFRTYTSLASPRHSLTLLATFTLVALATAFLVTAVLEAAGAGVVVLARLSLCG